MKKSIVGFVFLLGLTACAGNSKFVGSSDVQLVPQSELPAPSRSDVAGETREYVIGPYDKLTIDVFGVDGLQGRKVQVDSGGRIAFPLIGGIAAGGRTPGELTESLIVALRGAYVRDPQVTVNLDETISQVVAVEGEVAEPGLYPVIGRMTLLRAIARAQGATEFAKLDNVVVFRRVEGKQMAALYSLASIRKGLYNDPDVYANDVVVVGNSRSRRIFKDVLQASPLLTAPLIALLNNN